MTQEKAQAKKDKFRDSVIKLLTERNDTASPELIENVRKSLNKLSLNQIKDLWTLAQMNGEKWNK